MNLFTYTVDHLTAYDKYEDSLYDDTCGVPKHVGELIVCKE
jgi:hypothetical protein